MSTDKKLQDRLRKEWEYYCSHECPRRYDSEAGMPSCGPCGWEEDEEEAELGVERLKHERVV